MIGFSGSMGVSFLGEVPVDLKLPKELKWDGIGGSSLGSWLIFFGWDSMNLFKQSDSNKAEL